MTELLSLLFGFCDTCVLQKSDSHSLNDHKVLGKFCLQYEVLLLQRGGNQPLFSKSFHLLRNQNQRQLKWGERRPVPPLGWQQQTSPLREGQHQAGKSWPTKHCRRCSTL
eukprot:Lithocolla_globosa_v1_NODE_6164_length_1127_cov_3.466418.p2 type:complete len:110 gc:universal NODE_6164_length_1127_cov_3.466418:471-142(-)